MVFYRSIIGYSEKITNKIQICDSVSTTVKKIKTPKRFQCAISPERLTEIQDQLIGQAPPEFFRKTVAVFKEINKALFEHNPVLATAILLMFLKPDNDNNLVGLLLNDGSRTAILAELKNMQTYSDFDEVRTVESKLFDFMGNKNSLFTMNDPKLYLGIALEQYLLQRKLKLPLVMSIPIAADGTIKVKDRIHLREYLEKLELEQFKIERTILQGLTNDFFSQQRALGITNSENKVNLDMSTVGVKSDLDSIINSLSKEQKKKENLCKDISIGDINDLLRGRIIVEDYSTMVSFLRLIEDRFAGNILQIKNKFIEHKDKAYRAVHYYIRISDTIMFELQVKLYSQVLIGELEHEVVFKEKCRPEFITEEEDLELQKELVALHWGVQKNALKAYIQDLNKDKAFVKALKKNAELFATISAF